MAWLAMRLMGMEGSSCPLGWYSIFLLRTVCVSSSLLLSLAIMS